MADEPTAPKRDGYHDMGQPAHEAPETQTGRLSHLGIELGQPLPKGQEKAKVVAEPDHGLEVNVEGNNATITRVDSSQEGAPVKLGSEGKPIPVEKPAGEVVEEKPAAETPEAPTALPKLPDYDAAKPETVEAYTKAFVGADGKTMNMANLSADWQQNAKVAADGTITGNLSEGVYKFLESKGIDRATVKSVEAGQVARLTLDRNAVFTMAGGQEQYNAAIKWAREGGYDKAAADKFNADLNAGGPSRKDAVDLLMQRHTKAVPAARAVSPKRTTADAASPAGGPTGGVQPYENYAAYQADLRKARSTNDQALLDTSRARLKASPWHSGK